MIRTAKYILFISCFYVLSCSTDPVLLKEVIGEYHRAVKSNVRDEKLILNEDNTYIHFYRNLDTKKEFIDEGSWEYWELKKGGKRIRFNNWVFREKNEDVGNTYSMLFIADYYGLDEYIVLGQGVDDHSNNFRKLRRE